MPMPLARRKRSRSAARRSWGRTVFRVALLTLTLVLVVGSVAEIHAQSRRYRSQTDTGYGALATGLVRESNQTGSQLAALIKEAPTLTNTFLGSARHPTGILDSARSQLQNGLDVAVAETAQQGSQAAHQVPPSPTGGISDELTQVMAERAAAVTRIRSAVDARLGMDPLPIAGGPTPPATATPTALVSVDQATREMNSAGLLLQDADNRYRVMAGMAGRQPTAIRLPASVWVPEPVAQATLGASQLSVSVAALDASPALVPFHDLVLSAVGLSPPAVSTGGPGSSATSCRYVQSTVPGTVPTVLPPTSTVTSAVTVTNCGTVNETGVRVTQDVALSDPVGTPPPPSAGERGASSIKTVAVASGASVAITFAAVPVAGGHRYGLTVSIAIPVSQMATNAGGSSQSFLFQVSG